MAEFGSIGYGLIGSLDCLKERLVRMMLGRP